MRVLEGDDMSAVCARAGSVRRISMAFVGAQPPGAFVLVYLDSAVRVLADDEARQIDHALEALAAAARGEPFEHLFEDKQGSVPTVPEPPR